MARQRQTCTALMILGNAEKTINLCMDSMIGSNCFDEYILTLDARTNDRTPAILEGYRRSYPQVIHIIPHRWKSQDYATARNVGLKRAKMERIYWQDSDEVLLDPDGVCSLLQDPRPVGYHIWQLSPVPQGGDPLPIHQLRLFPHVAGIKWELPIHEQVAYSLREKGIPEELTPYRVWHTGYADQNINTEKHIERAYAMREWLKKNKKEDDKRAYVMEQYLASMTYLTNMERD